MCEPTTIAAATGFLSAFGTIADYSAKSSATAATNLNRANTQERAQKEAQAAAKANLEAVAAAQLQEQDALVIEQGIASHESLGARASAIASAAENGIRGVSIEHMLNDFEANQARFNRSAERGVEQSIRDDLAAVSNIQRDYQTRWDNGTVTFEPEPSILGPIAAVGGSVVGGYAKWKNLNPTKPTKKQGNSFGNKTFNKYEGL
tara:strand:+ start:2511 stop:3125 length:615 start_codon:yes stop_codon:yes gene_type:complete